MKVTVILSPEKLAEVLETEMLMFYLYYFLSINYYTVTIFKPNQQDKGKLTGSNFSLKICFR